MNTYFFNKGISVFLPLSIIGLTFVLMGSNTTQWTLLLMMVFTLGYTHYFIGGYYQIKGFLRHKKVVRLMAAFVVCVIFSAFLITVAQVYGYMWLVAFFAIPYFMLHGYFNEITLFEKSSALFVPRGIFLSGSLFFTGLTMFAFTHPSAYFGYDLSFLSPFEIAFQQSVQTVSLLIGDALAVTLLVMGVFVASYYLYTERQYRSFLFMLLLIELVAISLVTLGRPNYTYFFFLLLSYHFTTWALFYGQQFYTRSTKAFFRYIIFHVIIVSGAIFGYWLFAYLGIKNPSILVFNGNVFLFLTMVHITSSFLNDAWCRRLLGA